MGIFDFWPYTNIHEMNLDWVSYVVRRWLKDSEILFKNIDEQIEYLKNNFEELKEYVNSYFDSLDVQEAINNKLEEMLSDGELESIISNNILNYTQLSQEFSGSPVFRAREDYYKNPLDWTNSPTCGYQNCTIYSPSGDYGVNGIKYGYTWKSWSDNSSPELVTIDINNNTVINRLSITNGEHGGALTVYNNKLYSITNNYRLFIFNLSNPANPVLEEERTLSERYHIAGHDGDNFVCIDYNNKVYTTSDFSTFLYKYDIFDTDIDITQDYHYDESRNLLYRLSYRPNTIHVYNGLTGVKISTMRIPSVINYVGMAESEAVFIHDSHFYIGGQITTGIQPYTKLDFNIFYMDIHNRNTGRELERSEASLKIVHVDYNNGDPLNRGINSTSQYVFKYIEDAQNAIQSVNSGQVTIDNPYPLSFHIYVNAIYNFNNKEVGAFKVDENVSIIIYSLLNTFLGSPIEFAGRDLKPWVYVGTNSTVTFRTTPTIEIETNEIGIWLYRSHLKMLTKNYINNIYCEEGSISGAGIIGHDVYLKSSFVDVYGVNVNNSNTQYIDGDTRINARVTLNTGDRLYLNNIPNYTFNYQCSFRMDTGAVSQWRAVPELQVYKASDGSANVGIGYWSGENTYTRLPLTITRQSITLPANTYNLTALRYTITPIDVTLPQINGVMIIQD